jgi:glutathione S-transferase
MHVSGNCYKVRLAAHQLGIAITLQDYGLHDGSTRTPEFLAKNPNGRVPLLEFEDGRMLGNPARFFGISAKGRLWRLPIGGAEPRR